MSSSFLVILIIIITLILFLSEIFPISVTALMMILSFYFMGIIDSETVLAPFASETVMIIASMAVIGQAVFDTGGADKAGNLLLKVSKNERQLSLILVLLSGFISGFISNTAAAALLITFTLGICRSTGMNRSKLMYPVVLGCSFGGGLTIVGTTSGPFLRETLESLDIGERFGFFDFAPLSLILLIFAAIYIYFIGYDLLPGVPSNKERFETSKEENAPDHSDIPVWKRNLSIIVLICTFLSMIFEKEIGIPIHFSAMIGALIVSALRCVSVDRALSAIPLSSIIVYASMVPLSDVLTNSGAASVIADKSLVILEDAAHPILILIFIFLIISTITNFMSNAATIILFSPIAIIVAETLGLDIKGILFAVRFAGSLCFATPMATPANSMAIEPGGYRFKDFVKVGLPLTIISAVICIIYILFAYTF